MHSGFAGEQSIGIFTRELNRRGLDTRFFSGCFVQNRCANALALRPAEIHAQQNGGPVLRLRAASARLDGHDGVQVVAFTGKQCLGFELRDVIFSRGQFAI